MSNETKWTKGEWVFIDGDRSVSSAGGVVCLKPKVSGSVASKNWSSNAHLIAASPDLYDALEGLLRELPSATTNMAIQNARTALEKAKGRAMSQRAETPSSKELCANLKRLNDWRRGKNGLTMDDAGLNPAEIGRWIDEAIRRLGGRP